MSYREGKCRWGYRSRDLLKLSCKVEGVLLARGCPVRWRSCQLEGALLGVVCPVN